MNIAQSIAIVVPWTLWLLYWVATSNRVKETARKEASLSRTLQSIPLIGGGALIVLPDFNTAALAVDSHAIGPLQLAGLAVLLAGLAFSVWARLHLGTNWSVSVTLKEDHEPGAQRTLWTGSSSDLYRLPAGASRRRADRRAMARRGWARADFRVAGV